MAKEGDSECPFSRASYEATVATGLEKVAADECQEKLNCIVATDRGKITFCSPEDPMKVISLRTVDNVYLVLVRETPKEMPKDAGGDLKDKLSQLLDRVDWNTGIKIWKKVFNYDKATFDQVLAPGEAHMDIKPKFRVTCYRAGEGHKFGSPDAAKEFGGLINEKFKWPVSMKEFDLQVMLHIKDRNWYVSICLTRDSLHLRNLVSLGVTTLKATVCHSMLRIAQVATGDVICDPCAGTGAIMVESAISIGVDCFNLAADHHPEAVKHFTKNIPWADSHKPHGPLDGLECDSTKFPVRDASIDAFITDLPFGKRLGTKAMNKELYPSLLVEMARCLVLGSGRAVLLTMDFKSMKNSLAMPQMAKYLKLKQTIPMKLGNLQTNIYVIRRNNEPWSG